MFWQHSDHSVRAKHIFFQLTKEITEKVNQANYYQNLDTRKESNKNIFQSVDVFQNAMNNWSIDKIIDSS